VDVGKIDHGAWLTLCPVDERVGEICLKMLPMPTDFEFPQESDNQTAINFISRFVIDWKLEADGVAVPCNDETKAKYLALLLRLKVKNEEGKTEEDKSEFAVTPIVKFAADIENFLKN
jgi:hypothetical protein